MKSIFKDRRLKQDSSHKLSIFNKRQFPFSSVYVDTALLEHFFYELRFQSYIEEGRAPLEINKIFNKIETDEYDEHALKFLLLFKPLHLFFGGVRIILPDLKKDFCGLPTLERSEEIRSHIPEEKWNKTAEVSRFLISKTHAEVMLKYMKNNWEDFDIIKFQKQQIATLFLPCFKMFLHQKATQLIFSVEKTLARILKKSGLPIIVMNETILHHGEREVVLLSSEDTKENLKIKNPDLLDFFISASIVDENKAFC